jgi:protein arginine kinase activator
MKCQQCEKPATFHITELTGAEPQELHLCEEHAREYLSHADSPDQEAEASFTGSLAQQFKLGQTAEELARLDQQACPVCGITFYEFRNQGRLGCPHDYECFAKELEPLLVNIHGDTEHTGKRPKHRPQGGGTSHELIRMRRQMKEAVEREDYEQASKLRDQIKKLEADA